MASLRRIILLEGVPSHELEHLNKKIKGLSGRVSKSERFTHIVCDTIKFSYNFLAACAKGAWIVRSEYVVDSFAVGQWLEERNYVHSRSDLADAAGRWRWRAEMFGEHPFSGWSVAVLLAGELGAQYKRILAIGGAKIVPFALPVSDNLYIGDITYIIMDSTLRQEATLLQEFGLICLHHSFITDTILKDEELDPFSYLAVNITEEPPVSSEWWTTDSKQIYDTESDYASSSQASDCHPINSQTSQERKESLQVLDTPSNSQSVVVRESSSQHLENHPNSQPTPQVPETPGSSQPTPQVPETPGSSQSTLQVPETPGRSQSSGVRNSSMHILESQSKGQSALSRKRSSQVKTAGKKSVLEKKRSLQVETASSTQSCGVRKSSSKLSENPRNRLSAVSSSSQASECYPSNSQPGHRSLVSSRNSGSSQQGRSSSQGSVTSTEGQSDQVRKTLLGTSESFPEKNVKIKFCSQDGQKICSVFNNKQDIWVDPNVMEDIKPITFFSANKTEKPDESETGRVMSTHPIQLMSSNRPVRGQQLAVRMGSPTSGASLKRKFPKSIKDEFSERKVRKIMKTDADQCNSNTPMLSENVYLCRSEKRYADNIFDTLTKCSGSSSHTSSAACRESLIQEQSNVLPKLETAKRRKQPKVKSEGSTKDSQSIATTPRLRPNVYLQQEGTSDDPAPPSNKIKPETSTQQETQSTSLPSKYSPVQFNLPCNVYLHHEGQGSQSQSAGKDFCQESQNKRQTVSTPCTHTKDDSKQICSNPHNMHSITENDGISHTLNTPKSLETNCVDKPMVESPDNPKTKSKPVSFKGKSTLLSAKGKSASISAKGKSASISTKGKSASISTKGKSTSISTKGNASSHVGRPHLDSPSKSTSPKVEAYASQLLTLPPNAFLYGAGNRPDTPSKKSLSQREKCNQSPETPVKVSNSQDEEKSLLKGTPPTDPKSSQKKSVQTSLQRFGFSTTSMPGCRSTSKKFPTSRAKSPQLKIAGSPTARNLAKQSSQSPVQSDSVTSQHTPQSKNAAPELNGLLGGSASPTDQIVSHGSIAQAHSAKPSLSKITDISTSTPSSGVRKSLFGFFNSLPDCGSTADMEGSQSAAEDNGSHHSHESFSEKTSSQSELFVSRTETLSSQETVDTQSIEDEALQSNNFNTGDIPSSKGDHLEDKLKGPQRERSNLPWTLVNSDTVVLDDTEGLWSAGGDLLPTVPVLYGQFMEGARELGLNSVAVSHGRPTCLRRPTHLLLTQLLALSARLGDEGDSHYEDVHDQACSYLQGWLNLHPPITANVEKDYAHALKLSHSPSSVQERGSLSPTFLMDFLTEALLAATPGSALKLADILVSVLEINFYSSMSSQQDSAKRLQDSLVVRWLWGNPHGVYYTSKPSQLVRLLGKMAHNTVESCNLQALTHVCSLISLVGECISLASNRWDVARSHYSSDAVLHLVVDIRRMIQSCSSPQLVLLILDLLKPAWLRALVAASVLSCYGTYLLSSEIQIKSICLWTIVTQLFFLVPHSVRSDSGTNQNHATVGDGKSLRAVRNGKTLIEDVEVLSRIKNIKSNWCKKNNKGETPLHVACIKNDAVTLEKLLACPDVDVNVNDNTGWTPLHEACNHGSLKCVELLLQYVPKPPNHMSALGEESQSSGQGRTNDTGRGLDVSRMRKANVNAEGDQGITPLIDAVLNNQVEVCRLLLHYGGPRLLQHRTCLGYCAGDLAPSSEMVAVLSEFSNRGDTPSKHTDKTGLDVSDIAPLSSLYTEVLKEGYVCREDFSLYLSLLCTVLTSYLDSKNFGQGVSSCREGSSSDKSLDTDASDRTVLAQLNVYMRLLERHMLKLTSRADYEALTPQLVLLKTVSSSYAL